MFSQDDIVERREDVEILNRFTFSGSHTTDVESEAVERSSRGERETIGFFAFCCYQQYYTLE